MLDVLIRGGEVVDGTAAARRRADVGIKRGRIVEIGEIQDPAARVIDASGKLVTPGFIDVHTHYDAQVFWDSALTPSPLHGVTTAIAGNCGFTIAPLSDDPADADYLQRMLARVEGMPLNTLRLGVPWSWKTTAEYFAQLDGRLGINLAFMIGHSSIRRVAMGAAANRRGATPAELARAKDLLRAGIEAGGLGLSSSYARTHNDDEGNMVPSRHAPVAELIELASVLDNYEGTSIEIIPQAGTRLDPWAMELMTDMSVAAQRPVNWNVMIVNAASYDDAVAKLAAGDHARARGGKVVALTMPISFGARLSFASGFILDAMPEWEQPMLASHDEKMKLLRDPAARSALNVKAQSPDNSMLALADWGRHVIFDVVASENEQYRGLRVADIAEEQGRDAWDVLCDIVVADELLTSFGIPTPRPTEEDWKARLSVWRDDRAVIGGSDAGAHFDLLAGFNYATAMLQGAVRQGQHLSFEEAVHLLTQVQAELYGLRQRGLLREGWHADVLVLDPNTIGTGDVAMRFDLPGGVGRLYAESEGVDHVLVNGEPVVENGALTDTRAGSLLRSGRDTGTPSMV
jgi:N-acyl-D-aspartate/D-glutamate deacylase